MLTYENNKFYMDGEPFEIFCGSMHYFRIFPEQWRDRLYRLKCLGFNTVDTYCAWNLHEPHEGEYDFDGRLDVEKFLSVAAELGLYVILRPGPYICSECDLGGLPAWLLRDDSVRLRSDDAGYFEKVRRYMRVLTEKIKPHLSTNGGNIIAVAAENEYGSFGNSRRYMNMCVELLMELGIDVPIITTDGHTRLLLNGGSADGALACVNYGKENGIFPHHTLVHSEMFPNAPFFHSEHWVGGNSHWGKYRNVYPTESVVKEVKEQLEKGHSFSFYMFHGGTNFGFFSGANLVPISSENRFKTEYRSTVTSYDTNAPLNEWGDCTDKYFAVQSVMEEYLGKKLPKPEKIPTMNLGEVKLTKSASLFDNLSALGEHFYDMIPRNMEHYGQNFGYILYRTFVKPNQGIDMLALSDVYDRTQIYFNGIHRGTVYRNDEKPYIEVDGWMEEGGTLELLVENLGRVNFGPEMTVGERKGICGVVFVTGKGNPRQMLCDWDIFTLPMESTDGIEFSGHNRLPAFFKGEFKAEEKKDCFVHLDNFTKGLVFVNGFNLGRYWNIGPQLSLYLPAPLLKKENEIIVFEEEALRGETTVSIKDYHILDSHNQTAISTVTGVEQTDNR